MRVVRDHEFGTRSPLFWLAGIALLLVIQHVFLRFISEQFIYEIDLARAPIIAFVISQMGAGFIFLCLLYVIPAVRYSSIVLLLIFTIGLTLRLLLFGTTPIMEIDFYRYLWDGAVLGQGYNPYLVAPNSAALANHFQLLELSRYAGAVFERVNYSDLRTIYPPLAELFFALAYWLDNWDLDAWRFVLLVSEIASYCILYILLNELQRSPVWISLYWWNPLVTKEVFNSAHMDALLVPFLLLAVLMLIRQRQIISSACFTLAAAIKLWPLLLIPFCLRPLWADRNKLIKSLLIIAAIAAVLIGPLVLYGLGAHSGLADYAQNWNRNSGAFQLILSGFSIFLEPALAGRISRLFIVAILFALVFLCNRRIHYDALIIIRQLSWVIAVLFLLGPAQYPWYFVWFGALLCVYPNRAFLLLTALLPIYYLRFYFAARGRVEYFDQVIVWFQYIPVLVLLIFDYFRTPLSTRMQTSPPREP